MTTKQIAEIRKRHERAGRPCAMFYGKATPMTLSPEQANDMDIVLAAVPRLLEEREALLEYLRELRRELPFDGPLEREVAAEIEKADAP
jgi:hypothetical protein